jgi:hypothetical protein
LAFNGSGVFNRVHNWVTDKGNAVAVTASRMDAEDDGMATGLSTALCKDGQQTATARIPFALGVSSLTGSVSAVSYGHINDLNTGVYFPASDQWGLSAGGVGTLTSTATALSGGSGITLSISGALTVSSGGAAITGNSTVTGTLGVSSDFAVATNKLTVAAASGNTLVAGTLAVTGGATLSSTLAVTGDVAVNTDKFTVTAASGNTLVAGTLTITGATSGAAITSSGAISGATVAGGMLATEAEQETGTATDHIVAPGTQHFHPSAAKAWGKFAGATGTASVTHNVTSVVRDSAGDYTVTIATDFTSADYVVVLSVLNAAGIFAQVRTQAAGTFTIKTIDVSGTDADPTQIYFACYGTI